MVLFLSSQCSKKEPIEEEDPTTGEGPGAKAPSPSKDPNSDDSDISNPSGSNSSDGTSHPFPSVPAETPAPEAIAYAQQIQNSTWNLPEDTPLTLSLVPSPPPDISVIIDIPTPPKHGQLGEIEKNEILYAPSSDFFGKDAFKYNVHILFHEKFAMQVSAEAQFTIEAVNDTPQVLPGIFAANTNLQAAGTALGTDIEGDPLTFTLTSPPTHGQVTLQANGDFVYTGDIEPQLTRFDYFTVRATDPSGAFAEGVITIDFSSANSAPTAHDLTLSTNEDTLVSGRLTASDEQSTALSFTLVSAPSKGQILTFDAATGIFSYEPARDANGEDTFTFVANDGALTSTPATVRLQVLPVNDAPVMVDPGTLVTQEDVPLSILLQAKDIDSSALTFHMITPPAHGIIEGDLPHIVYRPEENFFGTDSFTVRAHDGDKDSEPLTVSIHIDSVDDAPVCVDQSLTTVAGNTLSIQLSCSDPENDPFDIHLTSKPQLGTIEKYDATTGTFQFISDKKIEGTETLTFQAVSFQAGATSNEATLTIVLQHRNVPPTAKPVTISCPEDTAFCNGNLVGEDAEPDSVLQYEIVEAPTHSRVHALDPQNGAFTLVPEADFFGTDSFSYRVSDGIDISTTETVTVSYEAVNDAPVIKDVPSLVSMSEDQSKTFSITATDIDDTSLSLKITTQVQHGSVKVSGGANTGEYLFTYTPTANFHGRDHLEFQVCDTHPDGCSATAAVNLDILSVNDAPAALDQTISVLEDKDTKVQLQANDVDGDALTFAVVTPPQRGVIVAKSFDAASGTFTYRPNTNNNLADSLVFSVTDPAGLTAQAKLTIQMVAENDPPVALPQKISLNEDTPTTIQLTGQDPEGATLTFVITSQPTHGSLTSQGQGKYTYTPTPQYEGTDAFTFYVSDGLLNSAPATIALTINPVQDPPVAQNGSFAMDANTSLQGTLSATDPDSVDQGQLRYSVVKQPVAGTLSLSSSQFTYTPPADYYGAVEFVFRATDSAQNTSDAKIQITIRAVDRILNISAGATHNCALFLLGGVKCWGQNTNGRLGLGDTLARGDQPGEMSSSLPFLDFGVGLTATYLAAGDGHSCVILNNGSVRCWGNNATGQLGLGDKNARGDNAGEMGSALPAVNLGTGRTAKQLALGKSHSCALLDDSSVKCWGDSTYGQLGQGNNTTRGDNANEMGDTLAKIDLGTGRSALAITAGAQHTCALLDNSTVKCWGRNNNGQLGLDDTTQRGDNAGEMGDKLAAVNVGTGRKALQVSAGDNHVCALLDNSTVKCWGNNGSGQLGQGDKTTRGDNAGEMAALLAIDLGTGRQVMAVKSFSTHNCALFNDSSLKCWGANNNGKLGLGDTNARGDAKNEMGDSLPVIQVGGSGKTSAFTLGGNHTCALLTDKSLKCWGNNATGQLGLGDTTHRGDNTGEMGTSLPAVQLP